MTQLLRYRITPDKTGKVHQHDVVISLTSEEGMGSKIWHCANSEAVPGLFVYHHDLDKVLAGIPECLKMIYEANNKSYGIKFFVRELEDGE